MENFFQDIDKIKSYAEIQKHLIDLKQNASDEEIQSLINQIPQHFLTQKNDIIMICQLFAHYAKFTSHLIRGNAIKLFEKIKTPIKTYLKDDSNFLCKIFKGFYYFELMMYENGLITIDDIIMSILVDKSSLEAEYFLPEIIKERPEIFEKEIKYYIKSPYSDDYLQKFKDTRQKHIQWVRSSCDFHDPLYQEIETNKLRLSIKMDDVDTFQRILSNSNLSIDMKIDESIFDNYLPVPDSIYLIELAINYDSINIFKFLIMNNVKISEEMNFQIVSLHNNEIIHTIESLMPEKFNQNSLITAVGCWNIELHEYVINMTLFDIFEKSDVGPEFDGSILMAIHATVLSSNFIFFYDYLLPFLRRNSRFFNENFNEIVFSSLSDCSCFFIKEYLKDPRFNVNYVSESNGKKPILTNAILEINSNAVETFFQYKNLEIDVAEIDGFDSYQIACKMFSEIKILELFLKHPKFDLLSSDNRFMSNAYEFAVAVGNFYFVQAINEKCNFVLVFKSMILLASISFNHFMSVKLYLKKCIESNPDVSLCNVIDEFVRSSKAIDMFKEEYEADLIKIKKELESN